MKPYYQYSGCTIYHGDCREIIPTLGKFDLVLTDPPYGIGENHKKVNRRGQLTNPTDYGEFTWDSAPAADGLMSIAIGSATKSIVWGGNYFKVDPSPAWLVWDKQNGGNDFADCELAWTNLKMAVRIFRFMWNGMIRAGEARGVKRVHPTQKPVELMKWCLNFVPDAQTILDPFMGSGTTLVAAKQLGRQAVGIELDERCCESAARRLEQEYLAFKTEPVEQPKTHDLFPIS